MRITRIAAIVLSLWAMAAASIIRIPDDYAAIQDGIHAAANGDTILVTRGVYTVDRLLVDRPLVVASYFIQSRDKADIEKTIIRAGESAGKEWFLINPVAVNSKIIGLRIEGNNQHSMAIKNGYSEVIHCQFIGGKDQLSFEGSSQTPAGGYVGYCYFEGAGDDAIDCDNSGDWIIEHNTIVDAHQDAIEIRLHPKSAPVTRHIFRHNRVLAAGESGIQLINYPGDSYREFHIYRNVFSSCRGAGVSCMYAKRTNEDFQGSDMEERAFIYNNTFFGCRYGITMAPHLVILNNIFAGSEGKGVGASAYVTPEADHAIIDYCNFWNNSIDYDEDIRRGTRLFQFDPVFVDSIDFGLEAASECIDRGTALYVWEGDTVLNLAADSYHGAAPDLGAVEFGLSDDVGTRQSRIGWEYRLYPNFPNPFNPTTYIRYEIPEAAYVHVEVFNLLGRWVRTLQSGFRAAGCYVISWDGRDQQGVPLCGGIYFCQMRAGSFRQLIKMTLLK